MRIKNPRSVPVLDYFILSLSSVSGLMIMQLLEPDRCGGWEWKSWDAIRQMAALGSHGNRLFAPIEKLVKEYEAPESIVSSCLSASPLSGHGSGL